MPKIGIPSWLSTRCGKINLSSLFINVFDIAYKIVTCGDGMFESSSLSIVKIEMSPAITLRKPDEFGTVPEYPYVWF